MKKKRMFGTGSEQPYVLDVRVATVGAGADSTWHQRFKLRGSTRRCGDE